VPLWGGTRLFNGYPYESDVAVPCVSRSGGIV